MCHSEYIVSSAEESLIMPEIPLASIVVVSDDHLFAFFFLALAFSEVFAFAESFFFDVAFFFT